MNSETSNLSLNLSSITPVDSTCDSVVTYDRQISNYILDIETCPDIYRDICIDIEQCKVSMHLVNKIFTTFEFRETDSKIEILKYILNLYNNFLLKLLSTNINRNNTTISVYRLIDVNYKEHTDLLKNLINDLLLITDSNSKKRLKNIVIIKSYITKHINTFILEDLPKHIGNYTINFIKYEKYYNLLVNDILFTKIVRSDKLDKMIETNINYTIASIIRYNIFHPYSVLHDGKINDYWIDVLDNQIPGKLIPSKLLKEINIGLDVYSTPFVSVLNDSTKYCSLFYDIEYPFNVIGSFDRIDIESIDGNLLLYAPNCPNLSILYVNHLIDHYSRKDSKKNNTYMIVRSYIYDILTCTTNISNYTRCQNSKNTYIRVNKFYDSIRSSTFQIPSYIYYNIVVLSNSTDSNDVIFSNIGKIKRCLCYHE
jgi:hypothetical protein